MVARGGAISKGSGCHLKRSGCRGKVAVFHRDVNTAVRTYQAEVFSCSQTSGLQSTFGREAGTVEQMQFRRIPSKHAVSGAACCHGIL